jgi:hypothetical protein
VLTAAELEARLWSDELVCFCAEPKLSRLRAGAFSLLVCLACERLALEEQRWTSR